MVTKMVTLTEGRKCFGISRAVAINAIPAAEGVRAGYEPDRMEIVKKRKRWDWKGRRGVCFARLCAIGDTREISIA